MTTTLTPAKTLYASFPELSLAERAAAALLDLGARSEDISLVHNATVKEVRDWTEFGLEEPLGGWQPPTGAAPVAYQRSIQITTEGDGATPDETPYLDAARTGITSTTPEDAAAGAAKGAAIGLGVGALAGLA